MNNVNFYSSICNASEQHLTWKDYAKTIYNFGESFVPDGVEKALADPVESWGKSTFRISDVIKFANETSEECFVVLNGDIEIRADAELWSKLVGVASNGLVISNRCDYDNSYEEFSVNHTGIDFFMIPKKLVVPHDDFFCFGLCGWDWWIPFLARQQNIQVYKSSTPFAFHKRHEKRWGKDQLRAARRYFSELTGFEDDCSFKRTIMGYARYV